MTEFITKSGRKVVVNVAPFEAASNLWAAVQDAAAAQKMQADLRDDLESLFNVLLRIDSSPYFKAALWPCLVRCTVDNVKIDKQLFENVEIRKEYYQIISPCVDANIRPFAESLFSELDARMSEILAKRSSDPLDSK